LILDPEPDACLEAPLVGKRRAGILIRVAQLLPLQQQADRVVEPGRDPVRAAVGAVFGYVQCPAPGVLEHPQGRPAFGWDSRKSGDHEVAICHRAKPIDGSAGWRPAARARTVDQCS